MAQIKLNATYGLTGTLPAVSGTNLTNLDASDLTGALPAISGASLTGISSDYVRILTTTMGADATSVTMDNVFSATYLSYFVEFQVLGDSSSMQPRLRFLDSGGSERTTAYYYASWAGNRSSSSSGGGNECSYWDNDCWRVQQAFADSTSNKASWLINIIDPFTSTFTTGFHGECQLYDASGAGLFYWVRQAGWSQTAGTDRGFKLYTSAGNFRQNSVVSVYGTKYS